jgi:hypothetical protein
MFASSGLSCGQYDGLVGAGIGGKLRANPMGLKERLGGLGITDSGYHKR